MTPSGRWIPSSWFPRVTLKQDRTKRGNAVIWARSQCRFTLIINQSGGGVSADLQ
uniref:Uncharacterized protein n=1 Tax=Sphaeramia orbicularis TaxID=375764 RepID=A0A672ZIN7_9TELE